MLCLDFIVVHAVRMM